MIEKVEQLEAQANRDLEAVNTASELENFRIKHLGSKGSLKSLMGLIKDVPKDEKPAFGQGANRLKHQLQQAYENKKLVLGNAESGGAGKSSGSGKSAGAAKQSRIDITEPGLAPQLGRKHIISQTIDELLELFGRMGFDAEWGPEVEDERHNFEALNIPPEHPARDPLDNFYLNANAYASKADPPAAAPSASAAWRCPGSPSERVGPTVAKPSPLLLRSQTSTVQIRVMENQPPPIRIVSTGRVYRPDEHDATHYSMFHQIEGLYVDRHVSMVDLKTTLVNFARAYWGEDAEVKLIPSYFPFTEPSAELYVKSDLDHSGDAQWMEVGGCGMVDPNVFEAVGYDPEQWTGWAFGLGIERLAMRKYRIPDIRWLFENDIRFLRQF